MNIEQLHDYCLSLKGTSACFPFDNVTLVFKVEGKMFAMIPLESDALKITLKCDPEKALDLREHFSCVEPAYHFNKKFWNTICFNQEMKDDEVKLWIQHSIEEVVKKLPKKLREKY
ncbi:MAG: MmcQ/YjbR family DNA-binding protein [Bacteroidales bacterium]|jgi:predicted DNA-binding protein (MmcQ/YjbR family)|nr:MmcQ/YjbR family DNA-binding protein [Bacteroidales bacterium]